jgi:hypothetical protein
MDLIGRTFLFQEILSSAKLSFGGDGSAKFA